MWRGPHQNSYIIYMNKKAFWDRVKILIKAKSVTPADTAIACGVLPDTFRRWMSTERIPPLNYSYKLAQYLGVSLEYLAKGRQSYNSPGKLMEENQEVLILFKEAN